MTPVTVVILVVTPGHWMTPLTVVILVVTPSHWVRPVTVVSLSTSNLDVITVIVHFIMACTGWAKKGGHLDFFNSSVKH